MKTAVFKNQVVTWLIVGGILTIFPLSLFACAESTSTETSLSSQPSTSSEPTKWLANGIINPEEYSKNVSFDDGNFELYWEADAQYIYIGIKAKTTGWVSLGFPTGIKLINVDYIFAWVTNDKAFVADEFSAEYHGYHQADEALGGTEGITEFGGQEQWEYTTIEFKRALISNDIYDVNFTPGMASIIWAYGSTDTISTIHRHRGSGEIDI